MKGSLPEENYKFEFHFVNLLKFNFITSKHLVCILQSSFSLLSSCRDVCRRRLTRMSSVGENGICVRDVKSSCQVEDIFLCLLIKHILISIISIWYLTCSSLSSSCVEGWKSWCVTKCHVSSCRVVYPLKGSERPKNSCKFVQQQRVREESWKSIKSSATDALWQDWSIDHTGNDMQAPHERFASFMKRKKNFKWTEKCAQQAREREWRGE